MPQDAGGTEHRENIVAQCGQFDMLLRCERQQQDAKRKEQEIDRCEVSCSLWQEFPVTDAWKK